MRLIIRKFMCGALAAMLLGACATTHKTAEWRDPAYVGRKFDNILVIGVAKATTLRRVFESTLVDRLAREQLTAYPSYSIMEKNEKISEGAIKAAIAGRKIDAVLITHLVGVEQKEVYHPPRYSPGMGYYRYYSATYARIYEPGYYQRYKVVKLETTLYDVKTEKPVWSMQSDTIDPHANERLIKSAIKAVIKALREQALI